MIFDRASYTQRGNNNYGAVIRLPKTVGDRPVYFTINRRTGAWVIRDFLADQMLTSHESSLTVDDIEREADNSETPPYFNKDKIADWKAHLKGCYLAMMSSRAE